MRTLWAALTFAIFTAGAPCLRAHPADEGQMRIDVTQHRLVSRITFNLQTLQRFAEIDLAHDGSISPEELTVAMPHIAETLRAQILVTVNGAEASLGQEFAWKPVWPDASEDVPIAEQAGRFIDLTFTRDEPRVIEDFWLGFDFFHQQNDQLVVRGVYQQEGRVLEVSFSAQEPEFMYDTGYTPSSPATAALQTPEAPGDEPDASLQLQHEVFDSPVLRITFAIGCLFAVVSVFMKLKHRGPQ